MRSTIIAPNPWAATCYRLEAARIGTVGQRVLAIEHAVARLAGGFLQPISRVAVLDAVRIALEKNCPKEFQTAKDLPGLVRAVASSLMKAWSAGIDLTGLAASNERLASMAELERAVLTTLPVSMLRPADLKSHAVKRLAHSPSLLGPIRVVGRTEMSPVWRDIVIALADVVPVEWEAGPREVPSWLAGKIKISKSSSPGAPVTYFSCADGSHEVLEAIRWARDLIATGRAGPEEIAICAAAPQAFDAQVAAFFDDAALSVHFIHGRAAIESRDGQEAAALADIILSGLSLQRFRRLASLAQGTAFESLPTDWRRVLPRDAPLTTIERWRSMLAKVSEWPGGMSFSNKLLEIATLLNGGPAKVKEAGDLILGIRARTLLDRALLEGPAEALLTTLTTLGLKDEIEGLTSIVWGPRRGDSVLPKALCAHHRTRCRKLAARGI